MPSSVLQALHAMQDVLGHSSVRQRQGDPRGPALVGTLPQREFRRIDRLACMSTKVNFHCALLDVARCKAGTFMPRPLRQLPAATWQELCT